MSYLEAMMERRKALKTELSSIKSILTQRNTVTFNAPLVKLSVDKPSHPEFHAALMQALVKYEVHCIRQLEGINATLDRIDKLAQHAVEIQDAANTGAPVDLTLIRASVEEFLSLGSKKRE